MAATPARESNVASVVFQPEIRFVPPGCQPEDAEYAYPEIRVEFNYIPGCNLAYSSLYESGEDRIEFVAVQIVAADYMTEYLNAPAHEYGYDHYGRDISVAEYLARDWLDTDGYDKAVEIGRND
jgi:hypothetical protein